MSDPDPDPPERPRAIVALALGLVAAVLLAAAAIVITRDLSGGGDPDPPETSRPPASTRTPASSPGQNEPPEGCRSPSETPQVIQGQGAARELCHRHGDRLRKDTDAMFECRIGDRIEDCRPEAARAWTTLSALQADPAYEQAKALIDGGIDLAEGNGRRYLSPDCKGPNKVTNKDAPGCTTSYSTYGVGLSTVEYLLRSL